VYPTFSCCDPTQNLELVSAAPLTDPYHFLYRSHQDDFSRNVFTPGPALGVARAGATATPLLNGKVLIAGGVGPNFTVLNSTELYDPATNMFNPDPPMITARLYTTATLLPNGKVLIAGGASGFPPGVGVASTELYDPTTNKIVAGPPMNVGRLNATATLLPDGKVLIAGGGWNQNSTDLYDAYANSFAPAAFQPALDAAYSSATATLLPDGKVLIAGGSGQSDALNSTELYDPATNMFKPGPAMNAARSQAAATLLPNGKVLIAGGLTLEGTLNSTELYDPVMNTFGASEPMNAAHDDPAIVVLPNSQVLITGGFGSGSAPLSTTDLYTE
jgi:Galactose oxidase, central domain